MEENSPTESVRVSDHLDLAAMSAAGEETKAQPAAATTNGESVPIDSSFYDVRIAVVGNVDSGKSTVIGVLTSGVMDNGRGLARARVFLHKHENDTGRTSSISQHLMGYNNEHAPVYNQAAASASAAVKTKSWNSVIQSSNHIITYIDLCGHESYLKTTIAGLTGHHPDYAIVVINALAGVTKMTKEHLGIVLALNIPLIVIVTKIDLAPTNVLAQTKVSLFKILKSQAANKLPIQIKSSNDIDLVVGQNSDENNHRITPVFFVSCVTGVHINLLHEYISRLKVRRSDWLTIASNDGTATVGDASLTSEVKEGEGGGVEFMIDETFLVTGVGVVVSGTVHRGTLNANSTLLLGPHSDGSFKSVFVRSLHLKRMAVDSVKAGDSCAVSIRGIGRKEHLTRQSIRRGMVLVDPALSPVATTTFEATVNILHHPTTIKVGYQAVIHAGMIRQAASLVKITSMTSSKESKDCLRTGDKALARFRFLLRPEFIHVGAAFIFREGSTKGIGKIARVSYSKAELKGMIEEEEADKFAQRKKKNVDSVIEIDSDSAGNDEGDAVAKSALYGTAPHDDVDVASLSALLKSSSLLDKREKGKGND